MASLRLTLFGLPGIERDGVSVTPDRRKTLALLAYLALSPDGQSRDILTEMLWPERDASSARSDLRSGLFALRQAVGGEWLDIEGDRVALQRNPGLSVDVSRFRDLLAQADGHAHPRGEPCGACITVLTAAVNLYRGDFLAGFTLRDAPEFDNWQSYQTESLRLELAGALERLAWLAAADGDYEGAVRQARRWLELDPLCEEPHRALMRLYAEAGNRAGALRQYEECVRVLETELGVKPDGETTALRDTIAGGGVRARPVASVRPPPLELPVDRTPFIGREDELAQIAALLADPACRLLTVLGPGGSGKTRLAVQAARAQAGRYADGVYFVDLQPVDSADLLAPAIIRALAALPSGANDAGEQLIAYLRERSVLLVLDNLEHLLDGVELLPRLLDAAPGVKLLVTSRARLNLVEEWLLPLGGLALPPEAVRGATLEDYSATALFLACATRLRPDYHPSPREATEVVRVCRLLEGIPLGIELAAARTRTLLVGEIAAELARGLDVLVTTMRDAPARHRSMAAAFEGSWRMLSPDEQSILRQASVFRGGFTTEAAGAVTGATLTDLEGLVDSCWLRVEAGGHWGMHELIRQYCEGKLRLEHPAETGEGEAAVHDRHGRYYYSYVMAKQELLDTDERITSDVAPAFDNIVAAWEYWAASGNYEAVRGSLWFFVEMVDRLGWWSMGKPIIQRNIGRFEHADSAGLNDPAQRRLRDYALAALWAVYGLWEQMTGRHKEAGVCYDRAVAALGDGDPDDPAWAQVNLVLQQHRGILAFLCGDFIGSTEMFLDNLSRLQRATTQIWPYPANSRLHWQSMACLMIAHNTTALGQYADARAWAERSVALDQIYSSKSGMIGGGRVVLISPLMAAGDYDEAERCAKVGLRSVAGTHYRQQIAIRLCDLAHLYLVWGKPEQARVWGRRALAHCEDTGNIYSLHPALCWLAEAELALDHVAEAQKFFRRSLSLCNLSGALPDARYPVSALGLGRVALAEGKRETAVTWARRALASTARSADATTGAVLLMAEIERLQGRVERAAELLGCVACSPLAWYATRQKAAAALRELESELPLDIYAAAVARGESRELEELVADILADGDHDLS